MTAIIHFIENALCWELVILWLIVAALFVLLFIGATEKPNILSRPKK